MPLALIPAALATGFLILVGALASPDRPLGRVLRASLRRAPVAGPGGRAMLGLHLFGTALGIPIALGFVPASVFGLVGALVACTAGRAALSREHPGLLRGPAPWLAVAAWGVLAATLRYATLDLSSALGAQAVLGPAALTGDPVRAGAVALAGLAALVAAAVWVQRLPALSGSEESEALDSLLRWGESALAGSAVAAAILGPSLGALVHGPLDPAAALRVGASFLATALAVAAVSGLRRRPNLLPGPALLIALVPAALAGLAGAARIP